MTIDSERFEQDADGDAHEEAVPASAASGNAIGIVNVQSDPCIAVGMSPMPRRRIELIGFVMDTNRINARGKLPQMTQIEKWHQDGVISLVISDIAFTEVGKGKGGGQRRDKVSPGG